VQTRPILYNHAGCAADARKSADISERKWGAPVNESKHCHENGHQPNDA
jgi:hypothetical protein